MTKIKLCLVTFGIIVGLVGILHGGAEILQGSVLVEGRSVKALTENWPNAEFYSKMNGMPAISVLTGIPYYVLGLLAITISTAFIAFSATLIRRKKLSVSILLFTLLNLGIFLFGAGQGTPFFMSLPLIVAGIVLLIFPTKKPRSEKSKKFILNTFNFFFWLQIFSWILFFPGFFVLSFYTEIPQWLLIFDFMSMPVASIGMAISGLLYDKTV